MTNFYTILGITAALSLNASVSQAADNRPETIDLTKYRYQVDSPSAFLNNRSRQIEKINHIIDPTAPVFKASENVNPTPDLALPLCDNPGTIDAPDGETWYYSGSFEYIEIPPHDNIYFTDRILQSYVFTIYNSKMEEIGVIRDKMDYADNEVRVPLCEITPVATRNFFNTDDNIEIIVALAVNIEGGGNNYRSLVYTLNGEKDAEGNDKPIMIMDDLVADVIEGPSTDGKDNYFITFMTDIYEYDNLDDDATFWDFLLAQKVDITIYGKAIDNNGPRTLYNTIIPLIQFPGDQQSIAPVMSLRHGENVIYCKSYYAEPFYNQYDDPFSEEMTQRADNDLIIELYYATENGLTRFSDTNIPISLDAMPDEDGNPTALFSYYSVGNLRYTGDILFDAPGATAEKPYYIVTRANYRISTDSNVDSYFLYDNAGSIVHTLFEYADGTISLGDIEGFNPQQVFVSVSPYGYLYNFVDLYTGNIDTQIDANYYYDDDADPELLSANVARYAVDNTYKYVFEVRYPVQDDNGNDLLRFMYIDRNGRYDHTDYVNMGTDVAYAQSLLTTDALAPHAYSTSDNPTYMFLVKREVVGDGSYIEELMVAEAETTENPDGKTLLKAGPVGASVLASIEPDFAYGDHPGHLLIYYYDSTSSLYALDIYNLPIDAYVGINEINDEKPGISFDGAIAKAAGGINIYGLDGTLVFSANDSADLSSLPAGIYIIHAAGKSYKFIKR